MNFLDHMPRRVLIGVSIPFIALAGTSAIPSEKRVRGLWEMPVRTLAAQAWQMPKEEREMLSSEFKVYLADGKFGKPYGSQSFDILIRLGDRETTKSKIEELVADPFHRELHGLRSSGSPLVIEYLAPHGKSDEPYKELGTDVKYSPFSFSVTSTVFGILSDSSAFDGETIDWARRNQNTDPTSQRAELQRWWEENKIHFEQENYKAVKPGREVPTIIEVIDVNRKKAGLPSLTEVANEKRKELGFPPIDAPEPRQPRDAPSPPQAAAPIPETAEIVVEKIPPTKQSTEWRWAAGIVAFVTIVGLTLRKKKEPT